jgi:5-dehydro-4-deoxyglucarate dehydratase
LKLHELGESGDAEALAELLDRCVIPLYALRSRRRGYEVSAMKAMMDMIGLNGGPVRPPLVNIKPDEEDELRAILASWEKFL